MNWLDYLVIITIAAATIGGLRRGFSKTLIGMVTFLAATLGSIWMYGSGAALFLDYVSYPGLANLLGFIIVFAAISAAGSLIGFLVQKAMKAAGLGWLDRLLGGGVGFLQATLIASALIMAMTAFARTPPPKAVVESKSAPYVIVISDTLAAMAPRELTDSFTKSYEKVKESWKKMVDTGLSKLPTEAF